MEDFMIIGGATLLAIGIAYMIVRKINAAHEKRMKEYEAEMTRQREATRKWREGLRERQLKDAVTNTSSVPPRGKEMTKTYTPSYAPSPTQSVQSSTNDGVDLLTSMMIMNAITHHNQPSEPVNIDTSPKSYDNGPSYRDDSPSSSWSSSSSDSSWSSSSDSGPSPDW